MRTTFSILSNFFRGKCCLGCGSFLRSAGFLCPVCWEGLVDDWSVLFRSSVSPNARLTVRPLFHWIPGESDLLSRTLLAHKGSGHQGEWDWAARECLRVKEGFLPETRLGLGEAKKLVLIPAPSPTGRKHALEFARAFAPLLGADVLEVLRMNEESRKQQKKSRRERSKRSLFVAEEFSNWEAKKHHVILIDDVVTTGFTAEAARTVLRLPHLEVWCLAHRRRLAANA